MRKMSAAASASAANENAPFRENLIMRRFFSSHGPFPRQPRNVTGFLRKAQRVGEFNAFLFNCGRCPENLEFCGFLFRGVVFV